jgi:hypothetical protein
VRASCTQCPRRAADAVKAPIRPTGRTAPAPGLLRAPDCASGSRACWRVSWNRRLLFSARHGRLRRNALSHEGVRLSSAPGAPPLYRVLVSKPGAIRILLRDGIVIVPEVFWRRKPRPLSDTKSGGPSGRPGTFRLTPLACGTRRRTEECTKRCGNRGYLAAAITAAHINSGFSSCCTRSTGLAGSPRRPRIMEGPLVERDNRDPQRRASRV